MTTMTKKEFADWMGFKPSYITQLRKDGRLVMDGDRVKVEESRALIEASRDPSKHAVAERHEANREQKPTAEKADIQEDESEAAQVSGTFSAAKAMREHYQALITRTEYEKTIGKLLEASEVSRRVADIAVLVRGKLESMPDLLAPEIAATTDESRIKGLIAEYVSTLLSDLSSKVSKIAAHDE